MIMKGKDRGKSGKVALAIPEKSRIVIHGLNQVKKSVRPKKEGEKGQIISVASPVRIENVAIVCPSCGKPTKIGFAITKDKKQRICKKCKGVL